MEILYRKGRNNVVVDALSRMMYNMSFTVLENSLLHKIREAQKEDYYTQKARLTLKSLSQVVSTSEGPALSTFSL